jgi:hypothetical protein
MFILADANKNPSVGPKWFQIYSFENEFGIQSMSAIEMAKLTHKFAQNRTLLEDYAR